MKLEVTGALDVVTRFAELCSALGWPVEPMQEQYPGFAILAPDSDVLRFMDNIRPLLVVFRK
jgi:hypothetical protein